MTSSLSIPNRFTASTTIVSDEVDENSTAIETWADAIPDGDLASPNNSVYKTIMNTAAIQSGGTATGTYYMGAAGVNATGTATTAFVPPLLFRFTSGDYTVGSLTAKFRVNMQIFVGATSPSTVTYTAGLYPVTISAGNWTLGTVVTGSTALSSGLATNTISPFTSGDFAHTALLTDPGPYCLGFVIGSTTTPSGGGIEMSLQVRNV